jgi:HrpA-like RNA helicase
MIERQPVSVVIGATGSGKSSQIPQMIYRSWRERGVTPLILCTQPRRIAAISLAKRVADEMGESLGRTVGYMIGADRVVGRNTAVRFVTTGWAFEKLIHWCLMKCMSEPLTQISFTC